jgi:hypothetical protein
MKKRIAGFQETGRAEERLAPPVINIKGINTGLQSTFHLAECLERFAETGEIEPYEESYGEARLRVARSSEGIEITDGNLRSGMNRREALKWAGILRGELDRLNARQSERGRIRTVFADGREGRWVLQWGDEVMVPEDMIEGLRSRGSERLRHSPGRAVYKESDGMALLLDQANGNCVALDQTDLAQLCRHAGKD